MGFIASLFRANQTDFKDLRATGARIIDVRTPAEFSAGSIKESVNIPLDQLQKNMTNLKKNKLPIIVCCASGHRSGNAKSILEKQGFEVYNGGSWKSLQQKIS
mgnify:CR=1 FL=1|tara:strand:+ start:482 stop:790 length:309 start_codon:yes stop_codon:yes gene_type:complete